MVPLGGPPWLARGLAARSPDRGMPRRPRVILAVFVAAISVGGMVGAGHAQPLARAVDAWAMLLALVSPLAIVVLLPRRPVWAVLASVAATGAFVGLDYPWSPVLGGGVFVLAVVLLSGPRRRAQAVGLGGAVLLAGTVVAAGPLRPAPPPTLPLLFGGTWAFIVLYIAWRMRERITRRVQAIAEQARREEERREAERLSQAERQATAVADERLRIARELHDVLAHSLSAISVQAGVGLHLLDRDPGQARTALTNIRTTSADALDEVRAVLGVVRSGPDDVPRAPLWTVAAIPRLVELAGSDRRTTTLDLDPQARDLPEHLAGVVYRVVQEALTNVQRHAPTATRVQVRVAVTDAEPRAVTVEITDDGASASVGPFAVPDAASRHGYGLLGMRERVEGVGGTVDVGPGPDGWHVVAVVPWPRPPADGGTA